MHKAEPVTKPRLVDLLCGRHRRIAVDRWPVFREPLGLFDPNTCAECAANRDSLCPELRIKVLPDLEPWQFENLSAYHEAAHTIAALAVGHRVEHVSIERHAVALVESPAGGTALAPWSAPVVEHLIVLWAGQRAGLRRLDELGLETEANLVDLAWQGTPDLVEIDRWTTRYDLGPETGLGPAVSLISKCWDAISELAAILSTHYHLTGAQVDDYVAANYPDLASSARVLQ
jgi:hypothetical protein